jgi:hypothetical protein
VNIAELEVNNNAEFRFLPVFETSRVILKRSPSFVRINSATS